MFKLSEINSNAINLKLYNLTGDELLLIYLTLCAQDGHPEYFAKWFNGGGQTKLKDLFISLKEKGIIHKNYDPSSYIPDEIEFNKTFLKSNSYKQLMSWC